jgi:hypothetical protein
MRRFWMLAALCAAFATSACTTSYGEKEAKVREVAKQGLSHKLARPGFAVFDADDEGRLWVFRSDSPALLEYSKSKELAKSVSAIGDGPDGATVKAPDSETIAAYMKAYNG